MTTSMHNYSALLAYADNEASKRAEKEYIELVDQGKGPDFKALFNKHYEQVCFEIDPSGRIDFYER